MHINARRNPESVFRRVETSRAILSFDVFAQANEPTVDRSTTLMFGGFFFFNFEKYVYIHSWSVHEYKLVFTDLKSYQKAKYFDWFEFSLVYK